MQNDQKEPEAAACNTCPEYLAGWKRALADYDNLKKDLVKERAEIRQYTTQQLVDSLIPALDHFGQALRFEPDGDPKVKTWITGVLHVRKEFEEALRQFGAEAFGKPGEKFDPNLHEAVQEREDADQDDQAILEVVDAGWKLNGRVIRPARVIVNKR